MKLLSNSLLAATVVLQPLGALATDIFLFCGCRDAAGSFNHTATVAACQLYPRGMVKVEDNYPSAGGAKMCMYNGQETFSAPGHDIYIGFNNKDFRLLCNGLHAVGDSGCYDKPPLGGDTAQDRHTARLQPARPNQNSESP